jgi:hypothetical protein
MKNNILVQDKIIDDLSKEFELDKRVVRNIVNYPIKFTKDVIGNHTEDRPVRIKYFAAFTQKHIFNKDHLAKYRVSSLLDNIDEVAIMMATILEFPLTSVNSAKVIIKTALEQKDYEKINMIWKYWCNYFNKL